MYYVPTGLSFRCWCCSGGLQAGLAGPQQPTVMYSVYRLPPSRHPVSLASGELTRCEVAVGGWGRTLSLPVVTGCRVSSAASACGWRAGAAAPTSPQYTGWSQHQGTRSHLPARSGPATAHTEPCFRKCKKGRPGRPGVPCLLLLLTHFLACYAFYIQRRNEACHR